MTVADEFQQGTPARTRLMGLPNTPMTARLIVNFRANKRGYWSMWIFLVLFLVTLFAEFIANDKPLIVRFNSGFYTPIFNAYPGGEGPFPFPATEIFEDSITFANPAHDFPQKIKYWRDGDGLKAMISRMDDSRPGAFNFVPCEHE